MKTINSSSFKYNSKLETLYIGKNVSYISPLFKYGSYNGEIIIDEENPYYMIKDNILYSKDEKTLVTVLYRINGKFELSDNVERIREQAFVFQNSMLEMITNSKLKYIENSAFQGCSNLTRIEIPNSIETISFNAFGLATNLKEIIIHKEENSISGAPWGCQYGLRAIKWQP